MLYKVEILGRVPFGLTHNDVFATIYSVLRDETKVQTCTKRRLAGDIVSVIAVFEAKDADSAMRTARYAMTSVYNFSADIVGPVAQR